MSSSSSSTCSFDSDEESDIQDLKPIKGYLSNRRELARQLFKSVKSEKIRMMLPQILKNMNFNELEEWCASELCGMSEARISRILNGQAMLSSSDTSETDDSGPSLEIISDTEEWLTDTELSTKEETSSWANSKRKKSKAPKTRGVKKLDREKNRLKLKSKGVNALALDPEVKIKKEKDKEKEKVGGSNNKEGESLLDLLELEMRARVIRALIRKEEDVVPSEAMEKGPTMSANALRKTLDSAVSASLTGDSKNFNGNFPTVEKDDEGKSLEKSSENKEDEDVVFVVVKATPTIELSSSEADSENEKTDKNDDNEKKNTKEKVETTTTTTMTTTTTTTTKRDSAPANERIVTIDKAMDGSDGLKIVVTKRNSVRRTNGRGKCGKMAEKLDKNSSWRMDGNEEDGEVPDDENGRCDDTRSAKKSLFKKIRKKENLRSKKKVAEKDDSTESREKDETLKNSRISGEEDKRSEEEKGPGESKIKLEIEETGEGGEAAEKITKIDESAKESKKLSKISRVPSDDYRSDDLEEIIDLDDYPDDMDEMENSEADEEERRRKEKGTGGCPKTTERKSGTTTTSEGIVSPRETAESAETWASRYYQTDDVRNVIKESKIQSEIRKRLRERQRLSKTNGSPKESNSPGDGNANREKCEEKMEPGPTTGSVEEYFALKNSTPARKGDDETDDKDERGTSVAIMEKATSDLEKKIDGPKDSIRE